MTRMWGVDPSLLCDPYLLGEHTEMYQVAGTVEITEDRKGRSDTWWQPARSVSCCLPQVYGTPVRVSTHVR